MSFIKIKTENSTIRFIKLFMVFGLLFFLTSLYFNKVVVGKTYKQTARHIATLDYIKNSYNSIQGSTIDYLVLGDSTCLNTIKPKLIDQKIKLFCLSGASVRDSYFILTKVRNVKIRKGIIVVNSFNAKLHSGDDFWIRMILTNTYTEEELEKIYSTSLNQGFFPASSYSHFQFKLKYYLMKLNLDSVNLSILSNHIQNIFHLKNYYNLNFNKLSEDEGFLPSNFYIRTNLSKSNSFYNEYQNSLLSEFKIDKGDLFYLKLILDFINTSKLNFILVIPPMADNDFKLKTKFYKKSLSNLIQYGYNLNNKQFQVYEPINIPDNLFLDYNHVLEPGAELVSKEFNSFLKKLE